MAGWPDLHDYNDAIQYPDLCFTDPVLKGGTLALNGMLPRVASGNFATVYQLECGTKTYAVKCFHRPCHPDQANRYSKISQYLSRNQLDAFVGFEFLEHGIRIGGQTYPILKMEWVEGDLLDKFVEKNHANSAAMRSLAEQFAGLMNDLKELNIAHGDLQHGNVLVHQGKVKLIDYDGMFIPDFKGMKSYEVGHRNYQHPDRSQRDFNPNLDHFAAWVIYLSLMALSVAPDLWNKVKNAGSDCLLFHQKDFDQPSISQTFRMLENTTDAAIRGMVAEFRRYLDSPVSEVPSLPSVNGSGISFNMPTAAVVQTGLGWLRDHFPRRDAPPPPIDVSRPKPTRIQVEKSSVTPDEMWWLDHVDSNESAEFDFPSDLLDSEADIYLDVWDDTAWVWRYLVMSLRGFFRQRYDTYRVVQQKRDLEGNRTTAATQLKSAQAQLVTKNKERMAAIRELEAEFHRIEEKIRDLKAQIAATPALERDEIVKATAEDRERQLKANPLKSGVISGFGTVRIQALNDMGIRTAADINSTNEKRVKQALSIVHRALPAREWRTLKRWREEIEAAYQPPHHIVRRIRAIERSFDDMRKTLRQTINARQVELGIYGKRINGQDRHIQRIDDEILKLEGAIDLWHGQVDEIDRDLEPYRDVTFDRFLKQMRLRLPEQPIIPRSVSAFPVILVALLVMVYAVSFIFGKSRADDEHIPSVQFNTEWNAAVSLIDGVEMVLVPQGCLAYGGQSEGDTPNTACVDAFWMDRYEVTNTDFGSSGTRSEGDFPREQVTWFEARDYCAARGGRLPTEIEWEYAARGPDGLRFVWGNLPLPSNIVDSISSERPQSVFAIKTDVSWVGAVGMMGNVAEWTNSMMMDYPYDENDGREDMNVAELTRVVRGGSFLTGLNDTLPALRHERQPNVSAENVGFRCVVSY